MKLFRIQQAKQYGIRYITEDSEYKIWKMDGKSCWRLLKFDKDGNRYKDIQCFKYFKDAKQCLKDMLGE